VFANAAARDRFGAADLVGASVNVLVPPADPPMIDRVRADDGPIDLLEKPFTARTSSPPRRSSSRRRSLCTVRAWTSM
jgi:hypothetical protein